MRGEGVGRCDVIRLVGMMMFLSGYTAIDRVDLYLTSYRGSLNTDFIFLKSEGMSTVYTIIHKT